MPSREYECECGSCVKSLENRERRGLERKIFALARAARALGRRSFPLAHKVVSALGSRTPIDYTSRQVLIPQAQRPKQSQTPHPPPLDSRQLDTDRPNAQAHRPTGNAPPPHRPAAYTLAQPCSPNLLLALTHRHIASTPCAAASAVRRSLGRSRPHSHRRLRRSTRALSTPPTQATTSGRAPPPPPPARAART